MVQLRDGRVGKIVRVDTLFPGNRTEVSLYVLDVPGSAPASSRAGASASSLEAEDEFDEEAAASVSASRARIARVELHQVVGLAKLPA